VVILGIAIFFFLRLYRLPERVDFYRDQGDLLGMARVILQEKKLTALGPMVLTTEIDGRSVFYGSAYTYSTLILALVTDWNPLTMSALIPFFQFIAVGLASFAIGKRLGRFWGLLFFLTGATFPYFVYYSNFIWNPNYGMILAFLSVYLLELIVVKKKPILFILIGFVTGLNLQLHWLYWLAVPFLSLCVLFRYRLKSLIWLLLGIGIGNAPFFIFELRNNFYNLRTVFYILLNFGNKNAYGNIPQHYYVIFFPFLLYLLIVFLSKQKRLRNLLTGFLVGFILLSLAMSFRTAFYALPYGILAHWRYPDQLKAVEIISSQGEEYYNVASTFYQDTREYPVRFLLERNGQKLLPVDAYARTNVLYLLSDEENPLAHEVWELNAIKPATIIASWEINERVKLYKVIRNKKI